MHHTVHSDTLNYNLYTTENRTHIWGDGAHGTQVIHLSNVTNSTPPVRIFGMIDPIQNVSTGSYSDQLIVTIMY
jgi:spore coat protein U-like protein